MKIFFVFLFLLPNLVLADLPTIRVGSKIFTEGYLLAELYAQVIENAGEAKVDRKFGMGATGILFASLETGEIDLYPEYTGTLSHSILKNPSIQDWEALKKALAPQWTLSSPLGFNNTYALAVTQSYSQKNKVRKISDLKKFPQIRIGFSHEFYQRKDGYPELKKTYGLSLSQITPMEHTLSYEAIRNQKVDLIDVYSTDAKIEKLNLVVLEDDQAFFPQYLPVALVSSEFPKRFPKTWAAIEALKNSVDENTMIHLNAEVDLYKKPVSQVISSYLGTKTQKKGSSFPWMRLTLEHLFLVLISLMAAIITGVPLGIAASRSRTLGQAVLLVSGLFQTIPSLALLCFLIPLFGIGWSSALVALFLYGLLPIVRNTYTGFLSIDSKLKEVAHAMALTPQQRLWKIELPLARPQILGGIKTSAIINVGTATLAALIGAGGYGTLIVTGLALNDNRIILQGAIPAALMAILLHFIFEGVDRVLTPKGLRA